MSCSSSTALPDILIINISELSMLSELQKLTQNYWTTIVRVSLWALQVLFIAKFVCVGATVGHNLKANAVPRL